MINAGAYVILEVNKNYPRTFGDTLVHVSEADVLVESDRPIPTAVVVPYTDVDEKIGKNVASLWKMVQRSSLESETFRTQLQMN